MGNTLPTLSVSTGPISQGNCRSDKFPGLHPASNFMVITTCVGIDIGVVYSRSGGGVGSMLIKVGSAVGVVSTVSSVLVGGVLEVLLSRKVEIQWIRNGQVVTGSDSELTNKKLKHLHLLRCWISSRCNT